MYRKLGRESRIRRSILAGITKDVIMNEGVTTTEARAKEVRKFVDKMITYGKDGSLVARYAERNGGYTRIIKLKERVGDDALTVRLELVD